MSPNYNRSKAKNVQHCYKLNPFEWVYENVIPQHVHQKHKTCHSQISSRQSLKIRLIGLRIHEIPWTLTVSWSLQWVRRNNSRTLQNLPFIVPRRITIRKSRLLTQIQKTQSRQTQKSQKKRWEKNSHTK